MNKDVEVKQNIEEQNELKEGKVEKKEYKTDEIGITGESQIKKFIQPPIISHPSQLPTMTNEEINSGKLYASTYKFYEKDSKELVENIEIKNEEETKKEIKDKNRGKIKNTINYNAIREVSGINTKSNKYIQPPVVSHPSEPPTLTFEEINNGKLIASPHNFCDYIEILEKENKENENEELVQEEIIEKKQSKERNVDEEGRKKKNKHKNNNNKKNEELEINKGTKLKKYIQPAIISHPSQLPSIAFEEITNGKLFPSQYNFITGKDISKEIELKNNELFEKEESKAENQTDEKAKENKKKNKQKNIDNKEEKVISKENETKKYIQPPIVSHPSQLPSMIYEEINNGRVFPSKHNLVMEIEKPKEIELKNNELIENEESKGENQTDEKTKESERNIKLHSKKNIDNKKEEVINKEIKAKKYIQPPVVSHPSQMPSKIYEEVNNGKIFPSTHNISDGKEKPKEEEIKDTLEEIIIEDNNKETEDKKESKNKKKKLKNKNLWKNLCIST